MYIFLISLVVFMIYAIYAYIKQGFKNRNREDQITLFVVWLIVSIIVTLSVNIIYPKNYGYTTEYYTISKVNSKYVDTTYGMVNCIFIKNNLIEYGNFKNGDCEIKHSNKIKIPMVVIRTYEPLENNIYMLFNYEINKKFTKYTILLPKNK